MALAGCGGPQSGSANLDIEVDASRNGQALHVRVMGLGKGKRPGTVFEKSTAWRVRATSGGSELQRLVNGSARVTRNPVGHPADNRWDVEIRFDTAFKLPPQAKKSVVWVQAPGTKPERFVIAVR